MLPILIHGDAAFPGQGVVAETLNLHRLAGYTTGGTIHIIANNQIGFTTGPHEAYSTLYASGLARGFKIPILHVNADDPEACIAAARMAFAYRAPLQARRADRPRRLPALRPQRRRRAGVHAADDVPQIASHPTVRQQWATTLEARGAVDGGTADGCWPSGSTTCRSASRRWTLNSTWSKPPPEIAKPGTAAKVQTAVPIERLRALNASLLEVPDGFTVHRKLERIREKRRQAFDDPDERAVDWATAEELACATILADGTPIRLTGEDVERGTFSHRHPVLYDATNGQRFSPLESLPGRARRTRSATARSARTRRSRSSTATTCRRRTGSSSGKRSTATSSTARSSSSTSSCCRRARSGGRSRRSCCCCRTATKGQGPDHASARPERFLELAADINLRLANCTTAAQYFHLLRRQATLLQEDPLPLIVLTPKSLLRHPFMASAPRDLAEGRWMQVIDDAEARGRRDEIRRLVVCSGKIAVDLLTSPHRAETPAVAICRVEQLYPLPVNDIVRVIEGYPGLSEIVWVQEEPENMGAWDFVRPSLEAFAGSRRLLGARAAAQLEPVRGVGGGAREDPGTDREAGVRAGVEAAAGRRGLMESSMSVNIVVPEVGESIVDARVAKWLKQEGDAVEAGEAVVELETDKIDVEVPAPKKGVLRSIAHAVRGGREDRRCARHD